MQAASRPLRLCPATRDDVELILALVRELAAFERLAHAVVADPQVLAEQLFGERPAADVVIARIDDDAVGFALYFHTFSTFEGRRGLYLEDLYVRPAHRGLGVGRALMRHLARIALARGCARFEWSVLDWNAPAIAFYRSLGAVGMDEWTVQRVDGAALAALAAEGTPA